MVASQSNRHPALNRMLIFLLIACAVVAAGFGGLIYRIAKEINPPPEHLQDLDRLPPQLSDFERAPVDHIYLYRERCLHGNTFLRYHFVNTADFEAKKQRVHAEREEVVQRQKSNRDWQHVPRLTIPSDPTVDANATWWDWREQTDRELCSLPGDTVYVFDNARKVVYVYYGD